MPHIEVKIYVVLTVLPHSADFMFTGSRKGNMLSDFYYRCHLPLFYRLALVYLAVTGMVVHCTEPQKSKFKRY